MNYALPLLIAALGLFGLIKDWDAHKSLVRRVSVLILLLTVAVLSILNAYSNNRRNVEERGAAAQREEASKKAIEQLSKELTEANEKLEFQKGQLSTIAAMLKSNSTDPAVLAAVISQALHPPEKLPCLKPTPFTTTKRQSASVGSYETVIDVANQNGFKAGTTFQIFFNSNVFSVSVVGVSSSGGGGGNIATISIGRDIPRGQNLRFLAESQFGSLDVKCIDRFEPTQQH